MFIFGLLIFKDIQHAIEAKEPDVALCKDMGDSLKKFVIEDEKPTVDEALRELDDRWQSLRSDTDQLAKKLFSTQARLVNYQHDADELKAWLTATEGNLDCLGPVGVEPEKVKEQLGAQAVSFLISVKG